MASDSSLGSDSSPPSVESVLDGDLIKNCGRFCDSCNFCSFKVNFEGNPCFEMTKAVLSDFDDSEEEEEFDDDVRDRLPKDPFGMNIESAFTVFSDLIVDSCCSFKPEGWEFDVDEIHKTVGDRVYFWGLSLDWSVTENMLPQKVSSECNGMSASGDVFNGNAEEEILSGSGVSSILEEESQNCSKVEYDDAQGGFPHDALFYVLGYLGMRDLLSVEQVCRSLRDAVGGDPLLWRTVHIDQPLNRRITDDKLVKLTNRAQGTLQCLILVNCFWITDSGLGRVLRGNPRLMKLSVPDCIGLTIGGILSNLKALKSSGTPGLKHLRIGGLSGICHMTDQQFEELKELVDTRKLLQRRDQKPLFFRGGYSHIICEDGRAIDIDMCPKCQRLRPVYDCPAESCQQKHQAAQVCRGCTICIARCVHCGRCIKDFEYEETFCLEPLCMNCWNQFLHRPENSTDMETKTCTIYGQITMHQFCLYG